MKAEDVQKHNEMVGQMLIDLVKEHKGRCKYIECGISIFVFLRVFESIVGREATESERKAFY